MIDRLNETHDPRRRSWVESANETTSDFPIQNLPFGVFRRFGDEQARGGIAIGDKIFDLRVGVELGLFSGTAEAAARAASGARLNPLLELGNDFQSALRSRVSDLLSTAGLERKKVEDAADTLLVPMSAVSMELQVKIGSFTDFLCSVDHVRRMSPNGGTPPAFSYLPIAYNSRATSVRISGENLRRPNGEFKIGDGPVEFGPEPALDFELEVGAFVSLGNQLGEPIPISQAYAHLFGFCLLNDWSARSIQRWESQPLGPFLSKIHFTTISPWIVTAEAMAPFAVPARKRSNDEPRPLPHLDCLEVATSGGMTIDLESYLSTRRMRQEGVAPHRVTKTNFRHMYWTFSQMLTHHASNGCNLQPGDLIGSGTASGPNPEECACLAEATGRGGQPLQLSTQEQRQWLEDGDEVIFRARASAPGYISIGFGECRGKVEPAVSWPIAS